jgi:hypothetical protein
MLIINPSSSIVGGTYEDARKEAERLLQCIKASGITDVELLDEYTYRNDYWTFTYRHKITGKTGTWELTGLEQNYKEKGFTFHPRIFWNGSSCSSPEWKDFLTPEYELTVRKLEGE